MGFGFAEMEKIAAAYKATADYFGSDAQRDRIHPYVPRSETPDDGESIEGTVLARLADNAQGVGIIVVRTRGGLKRCLFLDEETSDALFGPETSMKGSDLSLRLQQHSDKFNPARYVTG